VVINNLGGNKLDYYLHRKIEYAADGCEGDTRKSTVTVTLTNTAPAQGLPEYVTTLAGGTSNYPVQVPVGTNVTSVTLLATPNSRLTSAVVDGEKATVFPGMERGHPTYEAQVYVKPGQTLEVKYLLTEPTAPGRLRVPVQPLIDQIEPNISAPECAG
jgi:hypothetical protein